MDEPDHLLSTCAAKKSTFLPHTHAHAQKGLHNKTITHPTHSRTHTRTEMPRDCHTRHRLPRARPPPHEGDEHTPGQCARSRAGVQQGLAAVCAALCGGGDTEQRGHDGFESRTELLLHRGGLQLVSTLPACPSFFLAPSLPLPFLPSPCSLLAWICFLGSHRMASTLR